LAEAEQNFRSVLEDRTADRLARRFDFSLDYEVLTLLGQTRFDRARQLRTDAQLAARNELLQSAAGDFEQVLTIDPENVAAHYNLSLIHDLLGHADRASEHRTRYDTYRVDDNARDRAVAAARKKYPAADKAAEAVVIYSLNRPGASGLETAPPQPAFTRAEVLQ
jgi:tetratricopeptide (TPR) repeat protein